ncbi:HAD-IA family hydrolase [Actinotignum urinale]|uniref:HAD-IA family hydrolase n=1 Tax=Actinotignum urinale TaxID=190146 RepID=UPI000C809F3D|nr:HAD-IA family hydrolase [Actinotignum urinale]MDY5128630.1 HAD-IA family hydrolase [Actinotignum urinale]WIK58518.1 HAD-IA family hydrolase [Actinotignum urinale]
MYRNIFWDLGGTMVDTYPQLDTMLAGVVKKSGYNVLDLNVAQLSRVSTKHAINVLSERFGIPEEEFRTAERALKHCWETNPPWPMPGITDILDRVKSVGGLNLVVTNRDRKSAEALLRGLGLDVDDIVCPEDGFPRKPDSAMHLYFLDKYGLELSECLAVGDRSIDINVAHAVGMDVALLETPGVPMDAPDADIHIQALAQLLRLIG